MKRIALITATALLMLSACKQKNSNTEDTQNIASVLNENDTIKPKTSYKVHKEYDEDGNLISVDSTYTYFYSNIKGDSLMEQKVFKNFKHGFDKNFMDMDSIMSSDFFNDNLFRMHDFYTDDFFSNRFRMNDRSVEDIFRKMDSLKNSFYKDQNKKL